MNVSKVTTDADLRQQMYDAWPDDSPQCAHYDPDYGGYGCTVCMVNTVWPLAVDAVAKPTRHLARILDAATAWDAATTPDQYVAAVDSLSDAIAAAREWVGTEARP